MLLRKIVIGVVLLLPAHCENALETWSKNIEVFLDKSGSLITYKSNYKELQRKFETYFSELERKDKINLLINGERHDHLRGIKVGNTALQYGMENDDFLIIALALEKYTVHDIGDMPVFDFLAKEKEGAYLYLIPSAVKYGNQEDIYRILQLLASKKVTIKKVEKESYYNYSHRMVKEAFKLTKK